jgi:hypothetical protein
LRFTIAVVGLGVALVAPQGRAYQGIRFDVGPGNRLFSDISSRHELTTPKVDLVSGTTAARLEQVRVLTAEGNWVDAVDALRDLAGEESDRVVAVGERRYVSLRTFCQMQLAGLPDVALAVYRRQVDPQAERWYRDGLVSRDEALLRRVVNEWFCSSWGDDALLALGELALERGDFAAARRNWDRISPLVRDPIGRPAWLALHDVDMPAHWTNIERLWYERPEPPNWLAFPGTDIELADVRARLVVASIRANEFERASLELEQFRRMHRAATGRIAGVEGPYLPALEQLLAAARDWPVAMANLDWATFARSPSRNAVAPPLGPIAGPAWRVAVPLADASPSNLPDPSLIDFQPRQTPQRDMRRPLVCHPIVADGRVYFSDATHVRAVGLSDGRPAVTDHGVIYRDENVGDTATRQTVIDSRYSGWPCFSLTRANSVLYARVGSAVTARLQPNESEVDHWLVGLDLSRDGLLVFRVRPDDGRWSFDGVPLSDGRRVFVAMRRADVSPGAFVACFDASSSRRIWRTSIGAADTFASGRSDETTHNLLTVVSDRIYFNSNLGLIAALDADDGSLCWLHRYERLARPGGASAESVTARIGRAPSPALLHDGLLIVAPSDSADVFALDADTGMRMWSTDGLTGPVDLLGVVAGNVVAGGVRLWGIDVRSGRVRFVWPDSETAGIRGMGRGVVAGREVFWPCRREVYIIDAATGAQTRPPIDLTSVGEDGANLVAADGFLIASGYDRMMAFGPVRAQDLDSADQHAIRRPE